MVTATQACGIRQRSARASVFGRSRAFIWSQFGYSANGWVLRNCRCEGLFLRFWAVPSRESDGFFCRFRLFTPRFLVKFLAFFLGLPPGTRCTSAPFTFVYCSADVGPPPAAGPPCPPRRGQGQVPPRRSEGKRRLLRFLQSVLSLPKPSVNSHNRMKRALICGSWFILPFPTILLTNPESVVAFVHYPTNPA